MRAKPYESEAKAARDWLAALRPEIKGIQMPGDRATLAKFKLAPRRLAQGGVIVGGILTKLLFVLVMFFDIVNPSA